MLKLAIITASTRPGRKGPSVAKWFTEHAITHGGFDTQAVDLAEVNLPIFDEPNHPRMRKYEHDHTKAWSALVDSIDAFVFVTPEYNFGTPPALNNALNYLYTEWNYKPVAFVSYGGLSGGTRAVQMIKQTVTSLKMVPVVEAVNIPFFTQHMDEAGTFTGTEGQVTSAKGMLDELLKWAEALKPMRAKA